MQIINGYKPADLQARLFGISLAIYQIAGTFTTRTRTTKLQICSNRVSQHVNQVHPLSSSANFQVLVQHNRQTKRKALHHARRHKTRLFHTLVCPSVTSKHLERLDCQWNKRLHTKQFSSSLDLTSTHPVAGSCLTCNFCKFNL